MRTGGCWLVCTQALSELPHLGHLSLFGLQGSEVDVQHLQALARLTSLHTLGNELMTL